MPRVSTAFFAAGVVYVLIGMLWGMDMGATGNHAAFPAHAHLNLLGWVTMALYGTFYALAREQVSMRLAWINFVLSNIGVLIMIPFLMRLLMTGNEANEPLIAIGGGFEVLGLLVFAWSVFRTLLKPAAAS